MGKVFNKIKKFFTGAHNVVRDEVEEVLNLKPTEQDEKIGELIANLAMQAGVCAGLPIPTGMQPIIKKAAAYAVADAREGFKEPEKTIIGRIVAEFKKDMRVSNSNKKDNSTERGNN